MRRCEQCYKEHAKNKNQSQSLFLMANGSLGVFIAAGRELVSSFLIF